jgi:hypothetical protein
VWWWAGSQPISLAARSGQGVVSDFEAHEGGDVMIEATAFLGPLRCAALGGGAR